MGFVGIIGFGVVGITSFRSFSLVLLVFREYLRSWSGRWGGVE